LKLWNETMAEQDFIRYQYYSQTEACKLFKISPKKFKNLIEGYDTINNTVTLHGLEGKPYTITTIYINKLIFYKIINNLKIQKI